MTEIHYVLKSKKMQCSQMQTIETHFFQIDQAWRVWKELIGGRFSPDPKQI